MASQTCGCITYWRITLGNWGLSHHGLSGEGHRPGLQTLTLADCATVWTYQERGEWGEGSADIGDRWPNSSSTRNKKKAVPSITHSDDCKFHNCGDLPNHYTQPHTAVIVHGSWKVKSGETTKHREYSAQPSGNWFIKWLSKPRWNEKHAEVRDWQDITVYS